MTSAQLISGGPMQTPPCKSMACCALSTDGGMSPPSLDRALEALNPSHDDMRDCVDVWLNKTWKFDRLEVLDCCCWEGEIATTSAVNSMSLAPVL